MTATHVTEFGLGLCAGILPTDGRYANMRARGLRPDTRACDESKVKVPGRDALLTVVTRDQIPTCPCCAVLRDEALEGRLPKRGAA